MGYCPHSETATLSYSGTTPTIEVPSQSQELNTGCLVSRGDIAIIILHPPPHSHLFFFKMRSHATQAGLEMSFVHNRTIPIMLQDHKITK